MIGWKSVTLFSDVDADSVQFAFDDYQFVWVDGRTNNVARRVIINQDGEIVPSEIGVPKPKHRATITGVRFSDRNDEGTGIDKGKILLVCYTYVNDDGSESNPSPITVIDSIQYQAKGYYTKEGINYLYQIEGGTYTFDQNRIGSIESFVLTIPVDNEFAKRINVYVCEADYVETIIPPSSFRLTTSRQVIEGATSATVTIAAIPGILEVSYENDLAPKGDDITLVDGITFIGNAVNTLGLTQTAEKIWALTISNPNKFNYTNRWIRLELFDETGAHPVGVDILEGLVNWGAEDMSLFRMLDSDLTTPLELLHYPLNSTVKVHKVISPNDDTTVAATLITDFTLTGIKLTAVVPGTSGNSISYEQKYGATTGRMACNLENKDYIVLTTYEGIYNVTIQIKLPGEAHGLSIQRTIVDDLYIIDVNLAHDGTNPTSTAGDVLNALQAATENAQVLDNIIISVATESDSIFDKDYVFPGTSEVFYFIRTNAETVASVSEKDITVWVAYNSELGYGGTQTDTIINAIYNNPEAKALVDVEALHPPGIYWDAYEYVKTYLSGGSGTPAATPSANIQTRMLSWIRIPLLPAYSEKTIYLVKFIEEPTEIEGEFIELIATGAPTTSQLLISDFYKDYVQENPISDENVLVAERPNVPALLNLGDSENGYSHGNAANLMLSLHKFNPPTVKYLSLNVYTYDELCLYNGIVPKYASTQWGLNCTVYYDIAVSGVNFAISGYAWVRTILRNLNPNHRFLFFGITNEAMSYVPLTLDLDMVNKRIIINYIDDDTGTEEITSPSLDFSNITWSDLDQIAIIMSWEQSVIYGTGLILKIGMLINGVFNTAIFNLNMSIDSTKDMSLIYLNTMPFYGINQYPALPTLFGLRTNETIDNEWQMLNILRFLPLFPTEGIGVYNEFATNTTNTISFANQNITIDKMQYKEDVRPGRIQWGHYGAMPDLNEYSINEDIMRIVPIKSFQPTDEHNTIFLLTKNNTALLALLGGSAETCTVTRLINGIGLTNRNALCVTNNGIVWLSQQGIMMITANGIEYLTKGKIDTSHISALTYDYERNWIWARGSYTITEIIEREEVVTICQVTYVYQVDEKLWWSYAGDVHPDDFMGCIDAQTGWISYTNNMMYKDSSTAHTTTDYLTLIKTRAVAMVKKLGRINMIGTLTSGTYKLKARMFSNKITGISTETAEFTETMNSPTAIPGVGADYVQLDIKQVNNIVAVAIEYENGVR